MTVQQKLEKYINLSEFKKRGKLLTYNLYGLIPLIVLTFSINPDVNKQGRKF